MAPNNGWANDTAGGAVAMAWSRPEIIPSGSRRARRHLASSIQAETAWDEERSAGTLSPSTQAVR